jgi:hypothetical protein
VAGTWPEYSWAPLSLDDPEPNDEAAA